MFLTLTAPFVTGTKLQKIVKNQLGLGILVFIGRLLMSTIR